MHGEKALTGDTKDSKRGTMPKGWEESKFDNGVSWVDKNRWIILLVGSSFFGSLLYMITFVAPKMFP